MACLDFRLKKEGTRNYFSEGIKDNESIRKKHKKTCKGINLL